MDFFNKVLVTVKPAVALFFACMTYLMIPEESFIPWCIALWVAALLDVFTRWFAIFVKSKGIKNALKTKAWNSESMFRKTGIKIVAYLVIQILAGLSVRFLDIPYISNAVANVIYAFLFFRELASNIENLIEAGAEGLEPILFWIKKKERDTLENAQEEPQQIPEELPESGGDEPDV